VDDSGGPTSSSAANTNPGLAGAPIAVSALNAAFSAALTENFAVVDQKIYQSSVDTMVALKTMYQELMTAMGLLAHSNANTPAHADGLWQQISARNYDKIIKKAESVFDAPGSKMLIPRGCLPRSGEDSSKPGHSK
jgi:hypothetical protein